MRMALSFQLLSIHQLYTAITGVVLCESTDVLLTETDKLIEHFGGDKDLTCVELVEHVKETVAETAEMLESGELESAHLESVTFYNELATKLLAAEYTIVDSEALNDALGLVLESKRGSRGETLSYLTEEESHDADSVRATYEKYSEQLKAQYPQGDNIPLVHFFDSRIPKHDLPVILLTALLAYEVVTGEYYSSDVIASLREQLIPPKDETMEYMLFMMHGGSNIVSLIDQLKNA